LIDYPVTWLQNWHQIGDWHQKARTRRAWLIKASHRHRAKRNDKVSQASPKRNTSGGAKQGKNHRRKASQENKVTSRHKNSKRKAPEGA